MRITMISHSCLLIELGGRRVLTDPWMTEPVYFGRLFHRFGVGRSIEDLPPLDLILASHGHDDHLDPATLRRLDPATPVAVLASAARKVRRVGYTDVRPMAPGDRVDLGELTVHACVGKHPGGQVTYVLQAGAESVFFGGDTAWHPELPALAERFGDLDVALLPVSGARMLFGRYEVHLDAPQAARLAVALAPRVAIPIHYHFELRRMPRFMTRSYDVTHTADDFVAELARTAPGIEARKLDVGETWSS